MILKSDIIKALTIDQIAFDNPNNADVTHLESILDEMRALIGEGGTHFKIDEVLDRMKRRPMFSRDARPWARLTEDERRDCVNRLQAFFNEHQISILLFNP